MGASLKAFCFILRAVVCTVCLLCCGSVYGQNPNQSGSPVASSATAAQSSSSQDNASQQSLVHNNSCNLMVLQTSQNLTLKQRACYFGRPLIAPQFALATGFISVFDQFRNSPRIEHDRWDKLPHRFEVYYARHAARDAGELLVGYLHHEDPRLHKSKESGFWRRTNSALMSVITSPDEEGHLRPALAPIAGSFSSALVGTVMYRHSETLPSMLIRAGGVYGLYFVRAAFAEFKPEFNSLLHRVLN
jgi:hypothetical protein